MALGNWAAFLISLEHRQDRRRRVAVLLEPHTWLREKLCCLKAVRGLDLAIEKLVPSLLGNVHSDSTKREESRFVPLQDSGLMWNNDWLHMTPGAVGCALSHRAAWKLLLDLASSCPEEPQWAMVLEDDLLWVAPDLERRLQAVVQQLPKGWHVCWPWAQGREWRRR